MERGIKIVLASAILLGGISVAQWFRHHVPQEGLEGPGAPTPLTLHDQVDPRGPRGARPVRSSSEKRPVALSPTILTPLIDEVPPPRLPSDYPREETAIASRWGTTIGMPAPDGETTSHRTHCIVDGDTLAELARRYLGDAARANEIFATNRDVLETPDVLPIGRKLRIPPRLPQNLAPAGPLVPIRPDHRH